MSQSHKNKQKNKNKTEKNKDIYWIGVGNFCPWTGSPMAI
jgi:hypothetical protein